MSTLRDISIYVAVGAAMVALSFPAWALIAPALGVVSALARAAVR